MQLTDLQTTTPARDFRLGWFVCLSLAVHAVVLGVWLALPHNHFGVAGGSVMNVTIHAILARPDSSTKDQPPPMQPEKKALASPRPSPQKRQSGREEVTPPPPSVEPQHDTQQAVSTPSASKTQTVRPENDGQHQEQQRQQVLGQIRLALAKHFHYPMQARRLGWQGTVLLGFHLNSNGRIEAIRIRHSSGHTVLDRAAISALEKVKQIQGDQQRLILAQDLTLPVIYHIERR